MEKTCACAELPAVLGTQSLPTSPPVSSSGFPSVARPHMCAREKQVRSIITLAPRAHFLGSRRRRVRLPTAAHSAGTLAPGPPRATASPVPRQGPGRRALGARPCRGHGRRRRLGGGSAESNLLTESDLPAGQEPRRRACPVGFRVTPAVSRTSQPEASTRLGINLS